MISCEYQSLICKKKLTKKKKKKVCVCLKQTFLFEIN